MIPNPLRWALIAAVAVLAIDAARMHVVAADLRTEHAEYVAAAEAQARKAIKDARTIEQKHAADIAEIVAAHQEEEIRARKKAEAVVADVRSGAIRLRKSLSCPVAGEPEASAAAPGSDAGEARGFTRADAEAALGIAADGDEAVRQLHACQAVVEEQQRACNGALNQ